jgi:hypothetical protein
VAEWRSGYRTGHADRAADHAGCNVARPEAAIALNLIALKLCALLLELNSFRSRVRTHRQSGRCDRGRQYGGCGQEL